jgi:hypothetical protein
MCAHDIDVMTGLSSPAPHCVTPSFGPRFRQFPLLAHSSPHLIKLIAPNDRSHVTNYLHVPFVVPSHCLDHFLELFVIVHLFPQNSSPLPPHHSTSPSIDTKSRRPHSVLNSDTPEPINNKHLRPPPPPSNRYQIDPYYTHALKTPPMMIWVQMGAAGLNCVPTKFVDLK